MNAICVFTNNVNKNTSGYVEFKETNRGLQIKILISGISPGKHGFHIHEYGDPLSLSHTHPSPPPNVL